LNPGRSILPCCVWVLQFQTACWTIRWRPVLTGTGPLGTDGTCRVLLVQHATANCKTQTQQHKVRVCPYVQRSSGAQVYASQGQYTGLAQQGFALRSHCFTWDSNPRLFLLTGAASSDVQLLILSKSMYSITSWPVLAFLTKALGARR